ncbi:MAG: hypothetical protein ABL931_17590, partial [Usitatibacteraceae bacterium]
MKIRLAIFAAVLLLPSLAFAAWISPVDQKYRKKNPALYAQVAKAQALISDSYGNSRSTDEGLQMAQAVIAKDPKFAPAYVQVARAIGAQAYLSSGKFDPAGLEVQEKSLQKALALEPDYDYAMALVGYNMMFRGKLAEADAIYKKLVTTKSGYPILKAQIAHLAIERKEYAKAIETASKGYEENKSDPKVAVSYCTELILAYEDLEGNHADKLEKWQNTRRTLAPEVAWFWGDHARHRLFNMNDYAGAITYGEKALTLMDYGVGRYTLAAAYYAKWADLEAKAPGRKDAADSLRRAEALSPID